MSLGKFRALGGVGPKNGFSLRSVLIRQLGRSHFKRVANVRKAQEKDVERFTTED